MVRLAAPAVAIGAALELAAADVLSTTHTSSVRFHSFLWAFFLISARSFGLSFGARSRRRLATSELGGDSGKVTIDIERRALRGRGGRRLRHPSNGWTRAGCKSAFSSGSERETRRAGPAALAGFVQLVQGWADGA